MPFYAPHTPFDFTPDRYHDPYRDSTFPDFPDTPEHPAQNPQLHSMHANRSAKLGYSSLVTAADANIGRVLERLEELGLRDRTLVIFSADQGWCAGHHGVWGKGNGTVPYNMYEESIRVPLIWNHPRAIEAAAPTPMVSSYDFFPTLLEYLGIDAPPPNAKRVGRSYAGFLRGAPPRQWTNRLFFEYSYVRALRTQTLKYVERGEGWPSELFDLEADPGESTNVIDVPAYRAQREALRRELDARFKKLGAPPVDEWRTISPQIPPAESHGPVKVP
jgi:arylsulfatase A-like enzyme